MNGFACFLPDEALLHLRGEKVPEFLQGQLTCDTRKLSNSQALMGALCNVKGRVLTDLTVVQLSDTHVVLRLRRSLALSIAETIQRYAQFSRISVEVDPSETAIVGVLDPDNATNAAPIQDGLVPVSQSDEGLYLQRGAVYGERIFLGGSTSASLVSQRDAAVDEGPARWSQAMLRSGHYAVDLDDVESFTPQTLNYDLTGLVAFDKGCYTGQEIVARLHYKGRSKKRLQIYETDNGADELSRDASLHNAEGDVVGRCLRKASADGYPTLVAGEVQSELLNEQLYLKSGEQLRSLDFHYALG
ncbi:folate-binding protein [Congregibacter brevis]|uniref:Folate-binding protein n=1 Tax=Congregibacter brevis TaxID=3081201 RepID=A0ABZ0I9U6_9GAMM|nr:folate-binding protein [Congregibacter sp. IMCC45268]